MLEPCVNQAAGLQGLALHLAPRLIAVSSHGDQQAELPLLWGLCTTWADMGFAVVVLDGHAQESPGNPGLEQLLDSPPEQHDADDDPQTWSIVPAARGFGQLDNAGLLTSALSAYFQHYGVVLIYADADTLTRMLKGSSMMPLLVVSPLKASSLSAYRALKHLLLDARLRPTVANIALVPAASAFMPIPSPAQHLQDCAMAFLGYAIKPLTITASAHAGRSQDQVNRLALQLLENAVPLDRHPALRVH